MTTQLEERSVLLAQENHRLAQENLDLKRRITRLRRELHVLRQEVEELHLARARWQEEANRLMDQLWDLHP